MRVTVVLRASIAASIVAAVANAAGCARAPIASGAKNAASSATASASAATNDDDPASPPPTSPAPLSSLPSLPPLPAPPGAPTAAAPKDEPHVAYRGASPFEPPSSPPPTLAPPAPRPSEIAMRPELRAPSIEGCAKVDQCGVCTNIGYCGYCLASRKCVAKDRYGAFPGACSAGYVGESQCPLYVYIEREEPKLRESLAALVRGLAPEGMPIDTKIDGGARVVRIPVRRGYCYGLVHRTSNDVENPWALALSVQSQASFVGDGGYWVDVYSGAGALTPFCPQDSGVIVAAIAPKTSMKGTWRLQLFRKPIADAELRDALAKHETAVRQHAVRYLCAYCARGFLGCRLNGEPQCNAKYAACMENAGLKPDDCERGDVPRPPPEKPKQPFDAYYPPQSGQPQSPDDIALAAYAIVGTDTAAATSNTLMSRIMSDSP